MTSDQRYLLSKGWLIDSRKKVGCITRVWWFKPGDETCVPQHYALAVERMKEHTTAREGTAEDPLKTR